MNVKGPNTEITEATEPHGENRFAVGSRYRSLTRDAKRLFCLSLCGSVLSVCSALSARAFDAVAPGKKIEFPRDAGAHLGHRVEWWYVTGQVETKRGPMGFQVTFFRVRNPDADGNASAFSPRQILFAHAALADPARPRLASEQRSARLYPGVVDAATDDTRVRIDDWRLERSGAGYRATVAAEQFSLELDLVPTQPALLQGESGFSRKGPSPTQASYYYSEPHLRVTGRVRSQAETLDVRGEAWLDHEWSSELLSGDALGWDWLGANLEDGAALMAFRIRGADGKPLWAGATYRAPGAPARPFGPSDVSFAPTRTWKSARTGAAYPVAMEVRVGAQRWQLEPLMDDQELDARASTGTVYWEGAVRVSGQSAGRGYLELTGYSGKLRF